MSASSESKYSTEVLSELLNNLQVADDKDAAANNIATFLNSSIVEHDVPVEFFTDLKKEVKSKDAKVAIAALDAYKHIASPTNLTPSVEPYVVELVDEVAARAGDKNKDVQTAASAALLAIAAAITPTAVKAILPKLVNSLQSTNKWTEKLPSWLLFLNWLTLLKVKLL